MPNPGRTATTNFLIDPFVVDDLSPLARVLASADVAKVIHNAQFEQSVLGTHGMTIQNIEDTMALSRNRRGPLAGGHSLLAVVRRELDLAIEKRPQTSDWSRRPLTEAQVTYAALDVELLVRLRTKFSR